MEIFIWLSVAVILLVLALVIKFRSKQQPHLHEIEKMYKALDEIDPNKCHILNTKIKDDGTIVLDLEGYLKCCEINGFDPFK